MFFISEFFSFFLVSSRDSHSLYLSRFFEKKRWARFQSSLWFQTLCFRFVIT